MKYLFGARKDNTLNADKFKTRQADEEKIKEIDNVSNEMGEKEKKATIPAWVTFTSYFAVIIGITIIFRMIHPIEDFKTAYENAGWLLYLGCALVLYFFAVIIIAKSKQEKLKEDPNYKQMEEKATSIMNDSREELNIPIEAIKIDTLCCIVKDKKDKEVIVKKGIIKFVNFENSVFIENDNLCFSDNYFVIAVPLSSIQNIEFVKERIYLPYWNKEEAFNSEKYKPYKLSPYNGLITVKNYYKVYLSIEGEDYYFNIPNYDIAEFKRLINYTKE